MRILIVTQYFWPESFLINSLATDLEQRSHQVSVLTGLPNYPSGKFSKGYSWWRGPWRELYANVSLFRVPILARGKGFARLALNYLSFVISGCFFSLFHAIRKNEIIFCFALSPITSCLPAIFMRWMTGKKLVIWVQDLWPESVDAVGAIRSPFLLKLIGHLVRFIYRRCDVILVQSMAFEKSILDWGGEKSKIRYIPNWADPFPAVDQDPEWVSHLPSGFLVSFAGNIGKAQDMATLIEAASLLREDEDIKWIVAGDGSDKKWLDQEISRRELHGKVITVGKKPYADMLSFFKKSDVMLVSLTDEPIFSLTIPSKVQAYMAAGRPIIGSIGGEGARIIEEAEAGLSCRPEQPEQLARIIRQMKEKNVLELRRMGENGKRYFQTHFERNIVIDQIENIFADLLQKDLK